MWSIFSRDPTSTFPYEIQEPVGEFDERTVWKLHKGRKKQTGDAVSVFICDSTGTELDLARAAVKRLKTFRHPCILTFVDNLESDKLIYLVTEPVAPLLHWLNTTELTATHRTNTAAWGLLQITKALSFLNNDGNLTHFNVCSSSVYVTYGGEWKLGGVEYVNSDCSTFPIKLQPQLDVYHPPEKFSPPKIGTMSKWSPDMWGLGCLVWEVFNGPLDNSMSLQQTSKIPKSLLPTYCELAGANPASRPNPKDVLQKLQQKRQFFNNDLIETLVFLEEMQIKDEAEKHKFLSGLSKKLDNIPDFVAQNKILPAVLQAHEFSNVGSVVLSPLFKIGKLLSEQEYQQQILPCVVKLFSSSDRATRLKLLQQVETLVVYMDSKTANDQIFPQLSSGFLDTNPTIREHTIKAILFLAPKLNINNLNVEVLKHFARLQSRDDQGGIRTNTTVCLGKIASYLNPTTRQKCLVSAFTRALRDPFPPARMAGAMALAATQQYFPLSDISSKVLPALCHLTMDPERSVRDSVFRVLKGYINKLEKVSEDPSLLETMECEVMSASSGGTSQVGSWAGWAVSALTSKFQRTSVTTASKDKSSQDDQKQKSSPIKTSESSGSISSKKTDIITPTSDNNRTSTKTVDGDENSDYEDWDTDDWTNAGTASVSQDKTIHTVSQALAVFHDADDIGDAWEDNDDWGSLKVTTDNNLSVGRSDQSSNDCGELTTDHNVKLASSFAWSSAESPEEDFFSAMAPQGGRTSVKAQSQQSSQGEKVDIDVTSPSGPGNDWGEWGNTGSNDKGLGGMEKSEDQKRIREDRKRQRQKDIEVKRAAKAGPMKLGLKKI